jgi:hypothetical protein
MRSLRKFYEEATNRFGREGQKISPHIKFLISALEKIFATMQIFEDNDAPLSCLVPEIADLSSDLDRDAHSPGCAEVSNIELEAIAIIHRKYLWRINSIFHFADSLSQWDEF